MSPIHVEFIFSEEEAVYSSEILTKSLKQFRQTFLLLRGMGWFLMFCPVFTFLSNGYTGNGALLFMILLFTVGTQLALARFWTRFFTKRQHRANPNAGKTIRWDFTAELLTTANDGSTTSFEWHKLIEVKEVDRGFLLFPQPYAAHWIPKHAFVTPADLEMFRGLIHSSNVKSTGLTGGATRRADSPDIGPTTKSVGAAASVQPNGPATAIAQEHQPQPADSALDSIHAEYVYSKAELCSSTQALIAANSFYRTVRRVFLGVRILLGIWGLYLIADCFQSERELTPTLILVGMLCGMPILMQYGVRNGRWKQVHLQYQQSPNAGKTMCWDITPETLVYSTGGAKSIFEWRKLIEVKEVKTGFLLFLQPRVSNWIPKHAFKSRTDVETFRALIRSSGVKHAVFR